MAQQHRGRHGRPAAICSQGVEPTLSSGQPLPACLDHSVLPEDIFLQAASSNLFMVLALKYSKAWHQLVLVGDWLQILMSSGSGTDQGSQC